MLKYSKILKNKLESLFYFPVLIVVIGVLFFSGITRAETSPDAIAIRIIPNPAHLSAIEWYADRGFSGSPQSMKVDGYDAVRDGRTVYVNVVNVVPGAGSNSLYTNIYLISYNQEAQGVTSDIFAKILASWKFNTNISIAGHCRNDNAVSCFLDDDCSIGDFCDSSKARIARDARRLSDMTTIQRLIDINGAPDLRTGTYIPNKTVSTWDSWRDKFEKQLGVSVPVDPVNVLGECSGYNSVTCWNDDTKRFATSLPSLMSNSLVYQYDSEANNFCSVFESGLVIKGDPVCEITVCLDFDGDGYGSPASGECTSPLLDCDDTNPAVLAASGFEICSGGVDEDCDGLIDCDDLTDCGTHPSCMTTGICVNASTVICGSDVGACSAGLSTCMAGAWGPCVGEVIASPELCNGLDDNCNRFSDDGLIYFDADLQDGVCAGAKKVCYGVSGWGEPDYEAYVLGVFGSDLYEASETLCDSYDNDCDGSVDDGLEADDCSFVCTALDPLYHYNASRGGNLRCCGDDALEGSVDSGGNRLPYRTSESFNILPVDACDDGRDNDCDGKIDKVVANEDTDCLSSCFGSPLSEDFWYVTSEDPDCDQCDHPGDDSGNQGLGDWLTKSSDPEMADKCDADCGTVAITVQFDDYDALPESICDDGIDNDCNGQVDCLDSSCSFDASCCVSTCTASDEPNCRLSASPPTNTQVATGVCCNVLESCYECGAGFVWNSGTSLCEVPCVDTCFTGGQPNCRTTAPVGSQLNTGGSCCDSGAVCYECQTGYTWNGTFCSCSNTCTGGAVCSTAVVSNASDNGSNCCGTETCYECDSGYVWSAGACVPACVDSDKDGYSVSGTGSCCGTSGTLTCGFGADCDDDRDSVFPGAAEACDGLDNDCNVATVTDVGCDDDLDGYCDDTMIFFDNFSVAPFLLSPCVNTLNVAFLDCEDNIASSTPTGFVQPEDINFSESEVCDDTVDNDCDGDMDCDDSDCFGNVACINYCEFGFDFSCEFVP